MNEFRKKLNHMMESRYGVDELGRFILCATVILLLISAVIRSYVLSIVIAVIALYGLIRTFSGDAARRRDENRRYLEFCERIRDKAHELYQGGERQLNDREHAYFHCPNCHQLVRVPRGKGRIMIHCPKCGTDFEKRT